MKTMHYTEMDKVFCMMMARNTMERVKKHTTAEQRKRAWVWRFDEDRAEFHGPDGFYCRVRACCHNAAKSKGWDAWLDSMGHNNDEEENHE